MISRCYIRPLRILGDVLDNLFKSNLRNLALLEDHLLRQKQHTILLMPQGGAFLPKPASAKHSFWGRGKAKEKRRVPKADRSRRMEAWEGEVPASPSSGPASTQEDLD